MSKGDLEFNKVSAAVLLAGIIAMLSAFITNILYNPEVQHGDVKRGYKIEVAEAGSAGAAKVEEKLDIVALMTSADVTKGQKTAKKCVACHTFDKGGADKVGPNLWSIINKPIASKSGYAYSEALKSKATNWNYDELFAFLKSPKKYAKGTKMSFAGIKKPKQIADLVEYLRQQSDNPASLPQ